MCTQFQPMRFNVGSDGILLLAQSDINSCLTTFILTNKNIYIIVNLITDYYIQTDKQLLYDHLHYPIHAYR